MAKEDVSYVGFFLMDSGVKVRFDISEENGGKEFSVDLCGNCEFPFEKGNTVWLGEKDDFHILVDRIIGFSISEVSE